MLLTLHKQFKSTDKDSIEVTLPIIESVNQNTEKSTSLVHQNMYKEKSTGPVHQHMYKEKSTGLVHQNMYKEKSTGLVHQNMDKEKSTGLVHQNMYINFTSVFSILIFIKTIG